jgi:hypothetical protein
VAVSIDNGPEVTVNLTQAELQEIIGSLMIRQRHANSSTDSAVIKRNCESALTKLRPLRKGGFYD